MLEMTSIGLIFDHGYLDEYYMIKYYKQEEIEASEITMRLRKAGEFISEWYKELFMFYVCKILILNRYRHARLYGFNSYFMLCYTETV